jgi:hypothetical protein
VPLCRTCQPLPVPSRHCQDQLHHLPPTLHETVCLTLALHPKFPIMALALS